MAPFKIDIRRSCRQERSAASLGAVLSAMTFSGVLLTLTGSALAQAVPTDPAGGCPIAPATVASFFENGSVTLNGVAKPADSTQTLQPNCGFFQWTEQMFLWLTSPAPPSYGGNSLIMFSPKFFTVSPPDASGNRSFIPQPPGLPIRMLLRTTELGPHGLPALMSRSGQVIEVPRATSVPALPVIRLQNGGTARIANVTAGANGALQFFDQSGRAVQVSKLSLPTVVRPRIAVSPNRTATVVPATAFSQAIQAQKFIINRIPIFLDPSGSVIDVEPGQADSGVLISQNGALVYYITAVNDVLAYHRTMQTATIPDPTTIKFPMSLTDANAVKTFAAGKGHTIVDPTALAIETKSSWVEASAVSNPSDYLQVTATIPTFDKSNANSWVPNGETTVKLVMVGIHVVGSTAGHGEMVWGTFEHQGNAPDATYAYNATGGQKVVSQDTAGSWLFTPGGSAGPFNVTHASWSGTAVTGSPVSAAPILRAKPWGSNDGGIPANAAGLNTQVISANASVLSQLAPGDLRAKYFQLGTTWTTFGQAPGPTNQVGTNHLSNATIESFVQGASPSAASTNCFSCHTSNTVLVSHVYGVLKPLP